MAPSMWSTPGRCTGTKKLPLIPNEVYFEIFDYIQPSDELAVPEHKRILSNLALVCRFFCAVLLPRIFKSLKFSGLPHKESDTPGYASFCRALIRGKEPARSLALHVIECTFSQWDTREDHLQLVFNGFLGLYNQAITCMPNLESLVLFRTPINKKLTEAMSKLTRLKVLVMDDCEVYDDQDICKLSSLKLVTLEFRGDNYIRNLLELISPALRVFRTNDWDFARDFMTETVQCQIEELEFTHVEDLILLRGFLERTPSITKLNISSIFSVHVTPLGLSPSSLPQLHSIDCPSSLMLDFLPSRPLKRIALSGTHYIAWPWEAASLPPMTLEDIAVMTKSAAATRTLDIPADIYFVALMDHFPHLEKLRLDFIHPNHVRRFPGGPGINVISALCNAWPKTPPIRELELYFGLQGLGGFIWDLELQHHTIVSIIEKKFPTIIRLTFVEFVEWRRDGNAWRAFVPHRHHKRVQADLFAGPQRLKDYNGYYAALSPQSGELDQWERVRNRRHAAVFSVLFDR